MLWQTRVFSIPDKALSTRWLGTHAYALFIACRTCPVQNRDYSYAVHEVSFSGTYMKPGNSRPRSLRRCWAKLLYKWSPSSLFLSRFPTVVSKMKVLLFFGLIASAAACKTTTKQRLLQITSGFAELEPCELKIIEKICQKHEKRQISGMSNFARKFCQVSKPTFKTGGFVPSFKNSIQSIKFRAHWAAIYNYCPNFW